MHKSPSLFYTKYIEVNLSKNVTLLRRSQIDVFFSSSNCVPLANLKNGSQCHYNM